MGFLSDLLGPIATDVQAIGKEFQALKDEAASAVTDSSQFVRDVAENATKISDSVKAEASETITVVKEAFLPPDATSPDQ